MDCTNVARSEYYGALQEVVDYLFGPRNDEEEEKLAELPPEARKLLAPTFTKMQILGAADQADLPEDLQEIVKLLPSGTYTRSSLCGQLNSAITGHCWGLVYGTVS